jgi:hypothetical protein
MDWFPKFSSYQAFNNRLNRLSPFFELLINSIIEQAHIQLSYYDIGVLESRPIIVAKTAAVLLRIRLEKYVQNLKTCITMV